MWEPGSIAPRTGTVYLAEESIAFFSSHIFGDFKKIIKLKDVTSITKETVLGLFGNSVRVEVNSEGFSFGVAARDAFYAVLNHLWQECIKKWQRKLDPDGLGKMDQKAKVDNMAQLGQTQKNLEFMR